MDILKSVNLIKADGAKKPSSEALAGKDIILIYFSAHWCPPCRWSWSENMDSVITFCHSQTLHSHPR